ncbi:MAG: deoxynucleoside kinase [Proteobacteria bacterium]|nr:MAG: deoxynucleoside kinase [Pseudomonadota bacterium]
MFIAIAGNIGTGKTTLTNMLANHYGWKPHFESVADNPYLKDFYEDMARWSFPLQIYFLNHRYKVHREVAAGTSSSIQDRSIYEDSHIFARNLFESGKMEERDYRNYQELYAEMIKHLDPPDLMIYMRKSVPRLVEQISKRGRDYEKNIPRDYLECLNRYYDDWIAGYDASKLLVIDSNELDFVAHPEHFDQIAKQILEKLDQKELFAPISSAKRSATR